MHIELRFVRSGDEALFERIAPEVFDEPVDPARLAACLADPAHHMMIALQDGIVIGQCAAIIHRHPDKVDELYVDEIGISPTHQRQGIARRMMEAMFDHARKLGCGEAWLGTEPDNIAARRLYETLDAGGEPAEVCVLYAYEL